ncbi:type II toxin-antitoxin system RelE/ParE family toxin [Methanospirillum purgamenti]|uniref:Type II toxin-antitoxin system RelE/ParE family toxin n=1 Tax=Methanospirillum hungatei TaxID=2203 RepID=A0A8F5ZE06_METHU|nr:type II toxin-antitoxin system RelE/ParE family toxin [Methanospirillum hungatei]QXO94257.1 type II toxin-antitoxin system RelE/ParE family toxin [Methanospirillum hungatei]
MSKFTLLISKGAERDLAELPKLARNSLEVTLAELELLDNPREKLGPLKGRAKGLYSLRTGEYRAIIEIFDYKLMLLVIEAGHRKTIYRKYQN